MTAFHVQPLSALVVALLCASTCDDLNQTNKSKSSGTSDVLTQSEFESAFQDLVCANLKQCCVDIGMTLDTSRCDGIFNGAGKGSANSVFNPAAGEQCLAELKAKASCGTKNNAPTCSLVYKGMLAPGDSCTQSLECAKPEGGDANCDPLRGICVIGLRGTLGDECQQSCEQATDGSVVCAWGPSSSGYADGSRITNCFANDGLACGNTSQCVALASNGEVCVDDSSCSRELYCDAARGYICQSRRTVGQSCADYTAPCVAAAYCAEGTCASKKANGAKCSTNAECLGLCECGLGGDCATNGKCVDPTDPVGNYIALLILVGTCDTASN